MGFPGRERKRRRRNPGVLIMLADSEQVGRAVPRKGKSLVAECRLIEAD